MKNVILIFLVLVSTDPREIAKVNEVKKQAKESFQQGDYEAASKHYTYLDSISEGSDPAIKINLAHSYYQMKDTAEAKGYYQQLATSPNKKIRSIAQQQLGVMLKDQNKLEEALATLKSSLKSDPTNEGARFDYELVKKLLKEQEENKENNEGDQNQDQQDKEQQNKDKSQQNKDGDGEKEENKEDKGKEEKSDPKDAEKKEGDEKESQEPKEQPSKEDIIREKLKEMNINEEKAKMILEAMRNNEIQYIQQLRKKATKPKSDKPDW